MSTRLLFLVASCITFISFGNAQLGESKANNNRPYEVLLRQNLVLLLSVLSTLLVIMIGMAVCIYKPLRRR
ncbi:hypothetical protein IRJ41_016206 [Triplophysa rosa]|uniref:Uncharacterized protein n=1 Tax=Triplophysa rosa TaxID=992332 RepID=A0A9W8CBD0_TRIRA|nr:hypothetical protein IRJ41_016206 [Triplophysa rosa]